jgi:hypothetical protein
MTCQNIRVTSLVSELQRADLPGGWDGFCKKFDLMERKVTMVEQETIAIAKTM